MAETTHIFEDFALKMTRGDGVTLSLTVTKKVAGVRSAQSLVGCTVQIIGKRDMRDLDAAALFTLESSTAGEVTITNAAGGLATAVIPGAATANLPDVPVDIYVGCRWIGADGEAHTFQSGMITVYPGVSG